MAGVQFFNPRAEVDRTENRLPHWQQPGATVFVTFRLADSLPEKLLVRIKEEKKAWLSQNPEPWSIEAEAEYHRRFSNQTERWLDRGYGSCHLRNPDARAVVVDALRHFDRIRYFQHAWVVMPNHVHALFTLAVESTLEAILHSWKSFTAHHLVKDPAAPNPFWQEDYFDRMIRSEEHFGRVLRYIRKNPYKNAPGSYALWEHGSLSDR